MALLYHGAFLFKLLASKKKALLIRWYALLVLDLLINIINHVARLYLELDRFAGKHPHKNMPTAMQMLDQAEYQLHLDVIVCQAFPILNPASTPHSLQSSHCALSVHLAPNYRANPMA